jgi:hypothetical protein
MTGGNILDAQLHLLDRQILDPDGVPVCTVDDIELRGIDIGATIERGTPKPVIEALLAGPILGTRIFGGRPPTSRLERIPWEIVVDVDVVLRIAKRSEALDVTWVERWIRDRIIGRIPGGRHDPQ